MVLMWGEIGVGLEKKAKKICLLFIFLFNVYGNVCLCGILNIFTLGKYMLLFTQRNKLYESKKEETGLAKRLCVSGNCICVLELFL